MKFEKRSLNSTEQAVHDRAVRVSKTYKACERELISIIDDVDRLHLYEKFGETSTFTYCTKVLGLTESITYALQGIARKSRIVPELKLAIQDGEISVGAASRIASQITAENKTEWITQAQTCTRNELEQKLAEANPRKKRRTFKKPIDGKNTRLSVDLPNRVLEKQKRVRDLECKRTQKVVSEVEALEAALDIYLERHDPVKKAERALKKTENLARAKSARREKSQTSANPPAKSFKRASLKAKEYQNLNDRDRGECQLELPDGRICREAVWTEHHHIIAVADGGSNELANLITLCARHHKIVHGHHTRPN